MISLLLLRPYNKNVADIPEIAILTKNYLSIELLSNETWCNLIQRYTIDHFLWVYLPWIFMGAGIKSSVKSLERKSY